ncbi:hypothetical protein [Paraburkholderia caledonica]|uniref:hypothetical protein n=1 Tax=Paraburkholderia caledonica TaxID=134536 RepID=UPI0038BB9653
MARKTSDPTNADLIFILEGLLERNEDVTARAVARLHPTVREASSIIRNADRRALLEKYQKKQSDLRTAVRRVTHSGTTAAAIKLKASADRIQELEENEVARVSSHVAMIHAMAELGGTAKLKRFYEAYSNIRDALAREGSLPSSMTNNVIPITS